MNKTKRAQAQKPKTGGNERYVEAMQGKRSSNAAGPHRVATDYRRKPKHFKGWS